jgi:hypothetical protein
VLADSKNNNGPLLDIHDSKEESKNELHDLRFEEHKIDYNQNSGDFDM